MGIIIFFCILIFIAFLMKTFLDNKDKQRITPDSRMINAKVFNKHINTPIAISKNGYISFLNPKNKQPTVIHICNINGFEVIINGKDTVNIGGAAVGGLLFGGVGAIIGGTSRKHKIKKLNLLLKINDFDNPTINLPLLAYEVENGSWAYNAIQDEVQEILSLLELLEKKYKKKKE